MCCFFDFLVFMSLGFFVLLVTESDLYGVSTVFLSQHKFIVPQQPPQVKHEAIPQEPQEGALQQPRHIYGVIQHLLSDPDLLRETRAPGPQQTQVDPVPNHSLFPQHM